MYFTNFKDQVLEAKENGPIFHSNDLQNYKKKVHHYLKEHRDQLAIYKLRTNKKLTEQDLRSFESILWNELGTKEDYEKDFGDTPVTMLVRQIVGLDPQAVNEAFSEFLSNEKLNLYQSRFVSKTESWTKKVLKQDPFNSVGSTSNSLKTTWKTPEKSSALSTKSIEEIAGA